MTSTVPMASSQLVMRALRSGAPRAARPGAAGINTTRAASAPCQRKPPRVIADARGVLPVGGCTALQACPFLVQEIELKPNRKWDPLRPVRIRRDPPTLEEAVVAAQGLSDDIEQQVEIASGLMGVPQEEVRPVIASAPPSETTRGFERSSRAMPQVVVLRRRAVR